MNTNTTLSRALLLAGSATLAIQLAAQDVSNHSTANGKLTPAALPNEPTIVDIHSHDGTFGGNYGLWGAGTDYKVSFHDGMQFTPYLGSDYATNQTVSWHTRSITVGGQPLPIHAHPEARTTAQRAEYELRPGVIEAYDLRADGVEQTFVFAFPLPATGDLVVAGQLATPAGTVPVDGHAGFAILGDRGEPVAHYGKATAIDALGNEVAMTTRCDGNGNVELVLPQAALTTMTYPLTIDPLIAPANVTSNSGSAVGEVAMAQGLGGQSDRSHLMVVYERQVSATDTDLFVRIRNSSGSAAVSGNVYSDIGNFDSRFPAAGFVAGTEMWVFAYTSIGSQGHRTLRIFTRQYDVAVATNTSINMASFMPRGRPAIGGTREGSASPFAMVVFEEDDQFQAGSQSTRVRGVVIDTLLSQRATPTFDIAVDPANDNDRPAINPVSGGFTDGWVVAYQSYNAIQFGLWGIELKRVNATGAVEPGVHRADNTISQEINPRIAGMNGKYLLGYGAASSISAPGRYSGDLLRFLRTQRFDWPTAGTPTVISDVQIENSGGNTLRFESLAFDDTGRDFWAGTFYYELTGRLVAFMTGHKGGIVEEVIATESTAPRPTDSAVCFDTETADFRLVHGQDGVSNLVKFHRFAYPTIAPPSAYGTRCGGARLLASEPRAGAANFAWNVRNANQNSAAFLVVSTTSALVPLDNLGMPGCTQLVTPGEYLQFGFVNNQGEATFPFPLPDLPLFRGVLQGQVAVLDPQANALGVELTEGLRIDIQ